MALIGRVFVILFAVFVAMAAAGIALSIGILGPQWSATADDTGQRIIFWGAAFLASGIAATLTLMPILIAVVLAEAFSVRSVLIYMVAGAAIMVLAYYGAAPASSYEESIDAAPALVSREAELSAVAGLVFGFVYWLIAGRAAGRWRARM